MLCSCSAHQRCTREWRDPWPWGYEAPLSLEGLRRRRTRWTRASPSADVQLAVFAWTFAMVSFLTALVFAIVAQRERRSQ